jgi:hypothetical protein
MSGGKIKVAVTWGNRQLVEPSYKSYEVTWLRETTLRQLLAHVVGLADERISLNDAEIITTLHVIEHVDDVTSSRGNRKRTLGKTNAPDLIDELVYETITDCSTREFLFHVVPVKVIEVEGEVVNSFTVLRKAQSVNALLLPPTPGHDGYDCRRCSL